jgi:malonyl-CoA O-methyltransferase
MGIDAGWRPDKRQMRRAFDQAAAAYDAAAVLQQEIGRRLLERLDYIRLEPLRVLDAGCGTGLCLPGLRRRYPRAEIFGLDIAPGMLQQARRKQGWWRRWWRPVRFVGGDIESLPFADASLDLVFSNLTLQWCPEPDVAFREFRRVLKPGGLLLFSSFGPDTLKELRHSWAQVDDAPHVNVFPDMHDVGDALLRTPFAEPVMDMEMLTLTYPDVMAIMRDLKDIGAHNVNQGRPRGLTGKAELQGMIRAYENFRQDDGRLPVSYEVVYGHAWQAQPIAGAGLNVKFEPGNHGRQASGQGKHAG